MNVATFFFFLWLLLHGKPIFRLTNMEIPAQVFCLKRYFCWYTRMEALGYGCEDKVTHMLLMSCGFPTLHLLIVLEELSTMVRESGERVSEVAPRPL